jgi:hypothetical protein
VNNPYRNFPDKSFWARSISLGSVSYLVEEQFPYLSKNDRVVSMGSCFAANMVPHLISSGVQYVVTERIPKQLQQIRTNFNYDSFSARYGNIYTSRQMLQLVQRSLGGFEPVAEPWLENGDFVDPYRPGLAFPPSSLAEYKYIVENHLACVRKAIAEATVLVVTLGLTEAWTDLRNGAVFPACPGTLAGQFNPEKYQLVNLGVDEVYEDLVAISNLIRGINPKVRFLISVSPVPLVATATNKHVLVANTYSKSILRVAAGKFVDQVENARYIPSFEIITGPQAPDSYFESSRRDVSEEGINAVMSHFLAGVKSAEVKHSQNGVLDLLKSECEEVVQAHGR